MASNNQVILIGRLGGDPKELISHTQSGTSIIKVSLAVNDKKKDDQGNYITNWIPCIFWDKKAEILADYMTKGDLISVSGKLEVKPYEDKQGNKRSFTQVVAEDFTMLGSKKDRQEPDNSGYAKAKAKKAQQQRKPNANQGYDPKEDYDYQDEDADELPPF